MQQLQFSKHSIGVLHHHVNVIEKLSSNNIQPHFSWINEQFQKLVLTFICTYTGVLQSYD